jgi:hypothetical protein
MILRYHPLGQTGGRSDQLPNNYHHSHLHHPSEGAPLLRQAPRQLIARNIPIAIDSRHSAEQRLAPQLGSSI